MSGDDKAVLVGHVSGSPPEDWHRRSGHTFRSRVRHVAASLFRAFRDHGTTQDLAAMAVRRVEGEASGKYAAMARDFNQAEMLQIEAEVRRRTLEEEVRIKSAQARKEEAQATLAEIEVAERQREFQRKVARDAALIELLKTLKDRSLVLEPVGPNEFRLRAVHTFPTSTLESVADEIRASKEEDPLSETER